MAKEKSGGAIYLWSIVMMGLTKQWLADKVKENPSRTIGRALLAIYQRQTFNEMHGTHTEEANGIGFSKPDARTGSIGARQFKENGIIDPWLIKLWSKEARDGFPRICKYIGQLNAIAEERFTECEHCWGTGIDLTFDYPTVCVNCDGLRFTKIEKHWDYSSYMLDAMRYATYSRLPSSTVNRSEKL